MERDSRQEQEREEQQGEELEEQQGEPEEIEEEQCRIEGAFADEEDNEEEEEENEGEEDQRINYNTTLPAIHQYLGEVEEVSRTGTNAVASYEPSDLTTALEIPIYPLHSVVVFPGEKLPLRLFAAPYQQVIDQLLSQNNNNNEARMFGVVNHVSGSTTAPKVKVQNTGRTKVYVATVGTTTEIRSVRRLDHCYVALTKGKERFRILQAWLEDSGLFKAKVLMLPDEEPTSFPAAAHMPSHRSSSPSANRRKREKGPSVTWWPRWVYRMYDTQALATEASQWFWKTIQAQPPSSPSSFPHQNMELFHQSNADNINHNNRFSSTHEATMFSYWLAGNLALDNTTRQQLLEVNCTADRLRRELRIMKKYALLYCRRCGSVVAKKEDIFCMSNEGPVGSYVNAGGWVHQTLTLRRAQGLGLDGEPSTQDSWFPGYAWTIAYCEVCNSHMGWKFTAVSSEHSPASFWGLSRASIIHTPPKSSTPSDSTSSAIVIIAPST
ncbi:Upstream activation factor subunit spp27 [Balamuthia mandrillaris]